MNFPGDNQITFSEATLKEMITARMQEMMPGVRVSRVNFSGYGYSQKAEITFTTDAKTARELRQDEAMAAPIPEVAPEALEPL